MKNLNSLFDRLRSSRLANHGILLASRASVYVSGFLYNLVFSYLLTADRFGAFSALMALAELFFVPVTLGSSLLVYREARRGGGLPIAQIVLILVLGSAVAVCASLSLMPVLRFSKQDVVLAVLIALSLGATQLVLSAFRGFEYVTLFTIDPAIRYFLYIGSALALHFASLEGLVGLVMAVVLSNVTMFVGYFVFGLMIRGSSWAVGLKIREQIWLLASGLLGFAVRKSDLLILSIWLANSELGNFKIAVVLAEAPMQFVQAVMYKHSNAFEFRHEGSRRGTSIALASLGVVLSVGSLLFALVLQWYFAGKYDLLYAMPYLLVYYVMKIISLPIDQALIIEGRAGSLTIINALSAAMKVAVLGAGARAVGSMAVVLYPIIGLLDLLIIETIVRRYLKLSFLGWLVR